MLFFVLVVNVSAQQYFDGNFQNLELSDLRWSLEKIKLVTDGSSL